jgi:hypothetical protein
MMEAPPVWPIETCGREIAPRRANRFLTQGRKRVWHCRKSWWLLQSVQDALDGQLGKPWSGGVPACRDFRTGALASAVGMKLWTTRPRQGDRYRSDCRTNMHESQATLRRRVGARRICAGERPYGRSLATRRLVDRRLLLNRDSVQPGDTFPRGAAIGSRDCRARDVQVETLGCEETFALTGGRRPDPPRCGRRRGRFALERTGRSDDSARGDHSPETDWHQLASAVRVAVPVKRDRFPLQPESVARCVLRDSLTLRIALPGDSRPPLVRACRFVAWHDATHGDAHGARLPSLTIPLNGPLHLTTPPARDVCSDASLALSARGLP